MAKLFEAVLGAEDGLYHLFLAGGRVLKDGYSTPADAFKAWAEKCRDGLEVADRADRAIDAGENIVRFPVPFDQDDE